MNLFDMDFVGVEYLQKVRAHCGMYYIYVYGQNVYMYMYGHYTTCTRMAYPVNGQQTYQYYMYDHMYDHYTYIYVLSEQCTSQMTWLKWTLPEDNTLSYWLT